MDAVASGMLACRTKALQRTTKSCGPGAATLASSRRNDLPVTVAKQAAHRGEHEISRKAIARGKPGCPGCTCLIRVLSFTTIAHGAAGAVGARLSLRPLRESVRERDDELAKLRQNSSRENEEVCLRVIASEAKQSSLLRHDKKAGLLRRYRSSQ